METENALATITELHPEVHNPEMVEAVEDLTVGIQGAIEKFLSRVATNGNLPEDTKDAAAVLLALHSIRKGLGDAEGMAESHLVTRMEANKEWAVVTPEHTFEIKGGSSSTKWDGHGIVTFIVKQGYAKDWSLEELAQVLVGAGALDNASASWRSTKLRELGIPVDEYRETQPGRKRIEVI